MFSVALRQVLFLCADCVVIHRCSIIGVKERCTAETTIKIIQNPQDQECENLLINGLFFVILQYVDALCFNLV